MQRFSASPLLQNRIIVDEISDVSRGKLFEVAETGGKKSKDFMLRVYDASSRLSNRGIAADLLRAVSITNLSHPNLLKIYDVDLFFQCNVLTKSECEQADLLILSEMASGNLQHWLQKNEPGAEKLANGVLQGLCFLHSHHYVHRRLTPTNILIFEGDVAKLGDFHDLSIYYPASGSTALPVADEDAVYMAPEILAGYEMATPASDMWSFGVVLFEIMMGLGNTPFYSRQTDKRWFKTNQCTYVLNNIFQVLGTPSKDWRQTHTNRHDTEDAAVVGKGLTEHLSQLFAQANMQPYPHLIDFISQCLRLNPGDRITARNALKHPLFRKFPRVVGHRARYPKVPSTTKSLFRKEMVRSMGKDVSSGALPYYPSLLSIALFDRSRVLLGREATIENERDLSATCYILALKLLTNSKDAFADAKGAVIVNRWKILEMERMIVKGLKFQFFDDDILNLPETHSIFKRLENHSFSLKTTRK